MHGERSAGRCARARIVCASRRKSKRRLPDVRLRCGGARWIAAVEGYALRVRGAREDAERVSRAARRGRVGSARSAERGRASEALADGRGRKVIGRAGRGPGRARRGEGGLARREDARWPSRRGRRSGSFAVPSEVTTSELTRREVGVRGVSPRRPPAQGDACGAGTKAASTSAISRACESARGGSVRMRQGHVRALTAPFCAAPRLNHGLLALTVRKLPPLPAKARGKCAIPAGAAGAAAAGAAGVVGPRVLCSSSAQGEGVQKEGSEAIGWDSPLIYPVKRSAERSASVSSEG